MVPAISKRNVSLVVALSFVSVAGCSDADAPTSPLGTGHVTVAQDPAAPWIKTSQPTTLLSANDGQVHFRINADMKFDRENLTQDSITVVHLGPDHPPIVKTVYGTVPNSLSGSPYIAMTGDGHYGFVPSRGNSYSNDQRAMGVPDTPNLLSVIDLGSSDLSVIQKLDVPLATNMLDMHTDGKRLVVPVTTGFHVYEMRDGTLVLLRDNKTGIVPGSFDISPTGDRIIATGRRGTDPSLPVGVHVFSYKDGVIEHQSEVQVREGLPQFGRPFSLRFSPDARRVLVPNGGGRGSKGTLDDILVIDMTMTPPTVTDVIPQVADGIESLAFHPSGQFAVIACLDDLPNLAHVSFSHLAVVDLTRTPPRVLYHVNVEPFPEGIEFTPDGSTLFVQLTHAHHIAVFDVDQFLITRSPFNLRIGHGPASMAFGARFMK